MTLTTFQVATPVNFDPGIPGFVKASRHYTGPVLVMTNFTLAGMRWVGLFWVKRLIHNASRWSPQYFRLLSDKTRQAADRQFDYMLLCGPPPNAKRDSQKLRVYDWEDDNVCPFSRRPMSWDGCVRFTNYVWDRVGNGSPLQVTNTGRSQKALSLGGKIHLPMCDPLYRTKPIILHEIAHELTKFDQHGPEFVSTYMDLCARFLGLDRQKLTASATRSGVNFLH